MAYQKVGIELVLANFSGYMSKLSQVQRMYSSIGASNARIAQQIASINSDLVKTSNEIKSAVARQQKFQKDVTRIFSLKSRWPVFQKPVPPQLRDINVFKAMIKAANADKMSYRAEAKIIGEGVSKAQAAYNRITSERTKLINQLTSAEARLTTVISQRTLKEQALVDAQAKEVAAAKNIFSEVAKAGEAFDTTKITEYQKRLDDLIDAHKAIQNAFAVTGDMQKSNQYAASVKRLTALSTQYQAQVTKTGQAQARLATIQGREQTLMTSIATLKQNIIAKTSQQVTAAANLAAGQQRLADKLDDVKRQELIIWQLEQKMASAKQDNTVLQDEYNQKLAAYEQNLKDIKFLTDELAIAQKNLDNATDDVADANAEWNYQNQQLQSLMQAASASGGWLGRFVNSLSGMGGNVGAVAGAFGKLIPAMSSVAATLTVVGAAILGLGLAWKVAINQTIKDFERWKAFLMRVYSVVMKFATMTISVFSKIATTIGGAVGKIFSPLVSGLERIWHIASGVALYDMMRQFIYMIKDMTREVFNAVAAFQLLEVRLNAIAARDISRKEMIPLAQANAKAAGTAEELFEWIKRLAVTTPFTVEDIANVVTMATAMGFTTTQSKRLTIAIGNFTALLGLSDEVTWRIIYNLGQMIQRGKLTGEEFRDLTRNFFPVIEILERIGKPLNKTAEQMKQLAFEGGVPVNAFISEFIKMAEDEFPNAMKNLSQTWSVFVSNIKDFAQAFVGQDVFGPLLKEVTAMASGVFSAILENPAVQAGMKFIGNTIAEAFRRAKPIIDGIMESIYRFLYVTGRIKTSFEDLARFVAVFRATGKPAAEQAKIFGEYLRKMGIVNKTLAEARERFIEFRKEAAKATSTLAIFETVATKIVTVAMIIGKFIQRITDAFKRMSSQGGGAFADFVRKAYGFGQKITMAIAEGMKSALKAIIYVIKAINAILTYWLRSNSPPRVAPDIGKWGANTMREYMLGFTKVDFDIFDKITDTFSNFIKSLKLPETKVIPSILKIRAVVASAVRDFTNGAISIDDAARKIGKALNDIARTSLGAEFRNYVYLILQASQAQKVLEAATKRSEQAQNALNESSKKYDRILSELQAQLSEVTDEFDAQARLKKIDEALATNLLTAEERKRLEAEKQKLLIEAQIRSVEEQKTAEEERLQLAVDAAEAEQKRAQDQLNAINSQIEAMQALIDMQAEQNELIKEQIELLKSLRQQGEGGGDLGLGFAPMISENIGQLTKPGDVERFMPFSFQIDKIFEEAKKSMDEFFASFDKWLVETVGEGSLLNEFASLLGELATTVGTLAESGGAIDQLGKSLGGLMDKVFGKPFKESLINLPADTGPVGAIKGMPDNRSGFEKFIDLIQQLLTTDWHLIAEALKPLTDLFGSLTEQGSETIKAIGAIFGSDKNASNSQIIADAVKVIAGSLAIKALPDVAKAIAWGRAIELLAELLEFLRKNIEAISEAEGWAKLELIFDNAVALIMAPLLFVISFIGGFVDTIVGYFESLKYQLVGDPIVIDMMNAIEDAFWNALENVKSYVKEKLETVRQWFADKITAIKDFVQGLGEKINELRDTYLNPFLTWINETFLTPIHTWFSEKIADIKAWLQEFGEKWNTIKEDYLIPFKEFIEDTLTKALKTFTTGVLDPLAEAWKSVAGWILTAWSNIQKFLMNPLAQSILKTFGINVSFGGDEVPGREFGGNVMRGRPVVVGERRPEVFVPSQSGYIYDSIASYLVEALRQVAGSVSSPYASSSSNIDNSVDININANYARAQSPIQLKHDVSAALAMARL